MIETKIQKNISLSDYTSIGLGGKAKYFVECASLEELKEALLFARKKKIPREILGGGSNVIFSDSGFSGLIIKVSLKGYSIIKEDKEQIFIQVSAGENWDDFVAYTVEHGFAGVECLSGIPGLVGATPLQNVGAYGQEVGGVIVFLEALDRETLKIVKFQNDECKFFYRMSRFKNEDRGKYIITSVAFKLKKKFIPSIRYEELTSHLEIHYDFKKVKDPKKVLLLIRKSVIELRKKKSMVLDPDNSNTRSVGSFFLNPFLNSFQFEGIKKRWKSLNRVGEIPSFVKGEDIKIPAAWLVEQAGFYKGYRKNGVGISKNHSLALVNYGGTSRDLLILAEEIREKVKDIFGIHLEFEPVIIKNP